MKELLVGEVLSARDPRQLGRWTIESRLGFGGMGVVYLARTGQLAGDRTATGVGGSGQQLAAVKVIRPGLLDDPQMVERFNREVRVLSAVRDVHISQFLDANLRSEPAWLAIEYIPGPTVKQAVSETGPLSREQWWALAKGMSQALAVLEVHRVTHRDIKPGNVILSQDRAVLIDFGIAHPQDATSLTQTGLVTGSPAWLSPEQANADATESPSDVFSLGSLLAYAGTGRPPFGEGVAVAVLMRITSSEPDLAGLAPDQEELVRRMLAKDPAERPTAREVLAIARRAIGEDQQALASDELLGLGSSESATQVIQTGQPEVSAPVVADGTLVAGHTALDRPATRQPEPVTSTAPLPVTPAPVIRRTATPQLAPPQPVVSQPVVSQPVVPVVSAAAPPTPPAAPATRSGGRRVLWAVLALAAIAGLAFVLLNMLGGDGSSDAGPQASETSSSTQSTSPSASASESVDTGPTPAAPSSDQLKSGDWLLQSYQLVNDASSMSVKGTVKNTGSSAASATITTFIYVGGEPIGSVSTTVRDVPAGKSVDVTMTGDAKWQPGQKVLLVQAESL